VRRIHVEEMRRACDAIEPGYHPAHRKMSSELNCFTATVGFLAPPRAERYAAMTSLQRALGAISMSAFDHKRTWPLCFPMSALPPKADIETGLSRVRKGPKADVTARIRDVCCYPVSRH
jgi:hypothetical protein